jgi:hypothetical protein
MPAILVDQSRMTNLDGAGAGDSPARAVGDSEMGGAAKGSRGASSITTPSLSGHDVSGFPPRGQNRRGEKRHGRHKPLPEQLSDRVARCYRCRQKLPVEKFSPDPSKASGRMSICKPCDLARSREYYRRAGREKKLAAYHAGRGAGPP